MCLIICLCTTVKCEEIKDRSEKLISVFQVVKFQNSLCTGTTLNGTCFTSAECENIGGSSDGTCADGFGVCCTVKLTTTGSSSQNNTYLSMASDVTVGNHIFTVCPCSDDICRIKFDFTAFQLASPASGFGFEANNLEAAANAAGVGSCNIDTFYITSPSGRGSPAICGNNKNQHMIIDAAGTECLEVVVGIGSGTPTVTRGVDISVFQYACGDEMGGPPGCLQYFTNEVGKIRSFNFPDVAAGTLIPGGFTYHLHNQHYKICIRRGNGKEVICYTPCTSSVGVGGNTAGDIPTQQPSFGLSASETAEVAKSLVDSDCSTDYIWMRPGHGVAGEFVIAIDDQNSVVAIANPTRFCGRYVGTTAAGVIANGASICNFGLPFEVGVEFDDSDVCTNSESLITCESVTEITEANVTGGSGNLGFSLCYIQHINTT